MAARLAVDICGVPSVLIGRTHANTATLLANDIDERDRIFVTGGRTVEGFFTVRNGIEAAIARGLAYDLSSSLNWSGKPDKSAIVGFQNELASLGYKFQFGIPGQ